MSLSVNSFQGNSLQALEIFPLGNFKSTLYLCGMSLGNEIQIRRKRKGLKQEAFGKLVGLSKTSVSNIENDSQSPGGETLARIAKVLDCTTEDLTRGDSRFNPTIQADSDEPLDLEELFKNTSVTYKGRILSEDEKERIIFALYAVMHKGKNS